MNARIGALVSLSMLAISCSDGDSDSMSALPAEAVSPQQISRPPSGVHAGGGIVVEIGGQQITAELADNPTASDLAAQLEVAPNTLSFHLKELSHAGLISQERQGRNLIYRAAFDTMNALLAYLTENCCEGQACTPDGAAASCHC